MSELEQQTAEWLQNLTTLYGQDGVIHEVAAVLTENAAFSAANHRYRALLAKTAQLVGTLFEETGYERLLDCERDLTRLIQWADHGQQPVQLALFEMPAEAL